MTRARAPGKVLLLGEHAVVYGHPALAAAIPRYVTVEVQPAAEARIELPGSIEMGPEVLQAAVAMAREAMFEGRFHARVSSELPIGAGLGSSAALGVALARAFRPGCSPEEAASLAMHLERVLHGAPSGVDPAACAHGGMIFFQGGAVERVEERVWLCILPTGIARGTRSTVMPLAERRKSDPSIDPLLARLGDLARGGLAELRKKNFFSLGPAMDEAHGILRELGVSCPELEEAVTALKRAGALGAKLTGAGGGGAAIGLARDEGYAREIAAKTSGFAVEAGAG
jgi:mevalonate kinase